MPKLIPWRLGASLGTSLLGCCAIAPLSPGCSENKPPTTQPTSWYDQAKSDPYNFNPGVNDEWPDVSGGGIGHFDKKGFNRDMDHVFNP